MLILPGLLKPQTQIQKQIRLNEYTQQESRRLRIISRLSDTRTSIRKSKNRELLMYENFDLKGLFKQELKKMMVKFKIDQQGLKQIVSNKKVMQVIF